MHEIIWQSALQSAGSKKNNPQDCGLTHLGQFDPNCFEQINPIFFFVQNCPKMGRFVQNNAKLVQLLTQFFIIIIFNDTNQNEWLYPSRGVQN